jgi:recombination protein RecR
MAKFPAPIERLIAELEKLPGVGPRTAERFVFSLLRKPKSELGALGDAVTHLRDTVTTCAVCHIFTDTSPCATCSDTKRNSQLVCVVAETPDMMAIEKTHGYDGKYHILGGVMNPIDGVVPDALNIRSLMDRVKNGGVAEVLLALNPDLEGETTSLYLARLLKPLNVKITRLARGLPMGAELGYADEITLTSAIEGRREV